MSRRPHPAVQITMTIAAAPGEPPRRRATRCAASTVPRPHRSNPPPSSRIRRVRAWSRLGVIGCKSTDGGTARRQADLERGAGSCSDLTEQMLGARIVRATRAFGGYGPSATFVLRLDDGRKAFFKGVYPLPEGSAVRWALDEEERVYTPARRPDHAMGAGLLRLAAARGLARDAHRVSGRRPHATLDGDAGATRGTLVCGVSRSDRRHRATRHGSSAPITSSSWASGRR